jgi:predicted ATP-dependent endonuclease of OLD family
MKINFFEIQNFRKLKSCRIDVSDEQVILVGANNSGKTSAMDALILFLHDESKFNTRDFTLSNWSEIEKIAKRWIENDFSEAQRDIYLSELAQHLPQLDIWLNVEDSKFYYVQYLIPSLSWDGGLLGVRYSFEPKNIQDLYIDFKEAFLGAKNNKEQYQNKDIKDLRLWPYSLWNFLEKKLKNYFTVNAYILDPKKLKDPESNIASPQKLSDYQPLEKNPLRTLIKVDVISAQRGFSDVNTEDVSARNLSEQLIEYYDNYLDDTNNLQDEEDLKALSSVEEAKEAFNKKFQRSFHSVLKELKDINYPGVDNPDIKISTEVSPIQGLRHSSSVQYEINSHSLTLPEKSNGLGYQNLIYLTFKLISFRDDWMKKSLSAKDHAIEPIHLVLIEEPEAHLHVQVQQVFIRKAYDVLRKHHLLESNGENKNDFITHLIVSTHSSHIAHEVDFTHLRYFKRLEISARDRVPESVVVNLKDLFNSDEESFQFTRKYLKSAHCDIFFADAIILVEGASERILLPYFLKDLLSTYISILEIGGAYAHKFQKLIESLGILTLIITDIDCCHGKKSVFPEEKKSYITSNA